MGRLFIQNGYKHIVKSTFSCFSYIHHHNVQKLKSLKTCCKINKTSHPEKSTCVDFHPKSLKTVVKSTFSCFSYIHHHNVRKLKSLKTFCKINKTSHPEKSTRVDFHSKSLHNCCKINIFMFFIHTSSQRSKAKIIKNPL